MAQPAPTGYPISQLRQWYREKQLILQPRFQRGHVWKENAKSYLIDSVLRELAIPGLIVRLRINPQTQDLVRDVIDGQQRLLAVFEYLEDKFCIAKEHNDDFGGLFFSDLPPKVRQRFLTYRFYFTELQDISDREVLDLFSRINIYNEKLTNQEIRNSQYFGQFKRCVYKIAHSHYEFWRKHKILNEHQIARMVDVELVSIIAMSMLDGIRSTRNKEIDDYYAANEKKFPDRDKIETQFNAVIDIIDSGYGEYLADSMFKRRPLFFTLFLVVYDAKFGLLASEHARIKFTSKQKTAFAIKLLQLEERVLQKEALDGEFLEFYKASRAATADVDKRVLRHNFVWNHVIVPCSRV